MILTHLVQSKFFSGAGGVVAAFEYLRAVAFINQTVRAQTTIDQVVRDTTQILQVLRRTTEG
jgi:hypothetical protein